MRARARACALCLLLLLLPAFAWADIPAKPTEAFYVNDFAGVIDSADEDAMLALGAALEDACTAQLVVVTVDFLDGMTIDDYAYDLFNAWGIGQKDKDNGVLLLLSCGEREIQAMVGVGLEDTFSAAAVMRLVDDYALDALRRDDYSTGLRAVYEAACDELASLHGVSLSAQGYTQENYGSPYDDSPYYGDARYGYEKPNEGFSLMDVLFALVIVVIVLSVLGAFGRVRRGASPGCLFGWMLGRASRPRYRRPPRRPPPPPRHFGGFGAGPRGFGGRPGGFGGRPGGSGGSFRGPRSGGGGRTRGAGGSRKF